MRKPVHVWSSTALIVAAGFVLLFAQARVRGAGSQPAPLSVFVSNGMKAVMERLQPLVERSIGHPLAMQFDSTAVIKRKMDAGEAFDAAILTSDAITDLIKDGRLAADTRADLARVGIGIGIRKGAPKPDIHSSEAIKRTLLEAKSITYAKEGASRPYIDRMIDGLGISADLKPKISMVDGSGPATESVAKGQATIVITLISEEIAVPGLEVAGPLPREFQNYISFSAAAAAKSAQIDTAKGLIAFIRSAKAASAYKANGMEPAAH